MLKRSLTPQAGVNSDQQRVARAVRTCVGYGMQQAAPVSVDVVTQMWQHQGATASSSALPAPCGPET
jgi:hypothetical protein